MLCGPDGLWNWCLPDKVEFTPHQRKENCDVVCPAVTYDPMSFLPGAFLAPVRRSLWAYTDGCGSPPPQPHLDTWGQSGA
jgi:hypothetical protein